MALADGLVGYWSPWLGSSGYRLLDRTRYANHGTLTNMDAGTDWVGATVRGRSGSVLNIQDSQWADCGLAPGLNFTGPFAVAAWVRNISGAFDFGIVSKMTAADFYKGWGLITSAGTNGKLLAYWNQGTRATSATTVTQVSAWQLLSMQWTGTSAQVYINGDLDASSAYSLAPDASASTLNIGRYVFTGNNRSMRGDLAEACVWNRSLTRSEHLELYRLGPGWYQPYQQKRYAFVGGAGFKAYWHRRETQLIGGGLK
jgi:hypothetical protein